MIDVDLEAATLVIRAGDNDEARARCPNRVASLAIDVDAVVEAVLRQRLPEVLGNRPDKRPEPGGFPRCSRRRSRGGRARACVRRFWGDDEGTRGVPRQGCAVRRSGFDGHRQTHPGTERECLGRYQDEHGVPIGPEILALDHRAPDGRCERPLGRGVIHR